MSTKTETATTPKRGRGRPRKIPTGVFVWRNVSDPSYVFVDTIAPIKQGRGEYEPADITAEVFTITAYTALTGVTPRIGGRPAYLVNGEVASPPAVVAG